MGLFAVSPHIAFQCLIPVLLLCGKKIRVQNELMIKSGIELKNDKMVSQNPFTDALVFFLPNVLAVTYFRRYEK